MKQHKEIYLACGSEKGFKWKLRLAVSTETQNFEGGFSLSTDSTRKKDIIREKDRQWVYRNLPSSIHWYCEIHHDWKLGGKMFLLTKEEHKKRTKEER